MACKAGRGDVDEHGRQGLRGPGRAPAVQRHGAAVRQRQCGRVPQGASAVLVSPSRSERTPAASFPFWRPCIKNTFDNTMCPRYSSPWMLPSSARAISIETHRSELQPLLFFSLWRLMSGGADHATPFTPPSAAQWTVEVPPSSLGVCQRWCH